MMVTQNLINEGKTQQFDISKAHPGPKKREALPGKLITRIKILRFGIGRHFKLSLEEEIDCYLRDSDPESEVEIWETLNAAYYEFIEQEKIANDDLKLEVAAQLLSFSSAPKVKSSKLSNEHFEILFNIWKANCHLY